MKKGLIVLIIIIVVASVAYWYFVYQPSAEPASVAEESVNAFQSAATDIANTIASSVVPTANVSNAGEKIADETNPVEKSNPFADLKTNPFE